MTLTEKQVEKVTTTKANTGGLSGAIAPAIAAAIIKGVETYFMIDIPLEFEVMIISAVTGLVTYYLVWAFPNKPMEVKP